jgi:hypothetical protein
MGESLVQQMHFPKDCHFLLEVVLSSNQVWVVWPRQPSAGYFFPGIVSNNSEQ